MSTSKWAWTEACDGDFCPGDCDLCDKANTEADWICVSCVNYPPSAYDGKSCCACIPDEPLMSCYEARIGENE